MIVDWLTLVTEFVGMTAALAIFGVPPWITVIAVILLMAVIVLNGRYWTFEKLALLFCALNLVYIPGAFLVHPSVRDVLHQGLIPNFAGGFNGQMFFFLMANIGTTIAPWMLFFQQSAVVDKGMQEKDIPWGRFDTLLGSIITVVVAVFIVIVTGTVLQGIDIDDAAQAAHELMKTDRYVGAAVLRDLLSDAGDRRPGGADPARTAGPDYPVRAGDRRNTAAGGPGFPDLAAQRPQHDGRALQHTAAESHRRLYRCVDRHSIDAVRLLGAVSPSLHIDE